MSIKASDVKTLRGETGAGMMECKRALEEANGDFDKARDILRTQGLASAQKKSARSTKEGQIVSYIHMGGKIGVLLEINCETDFVAKTDVFAALGKDLCMQIAATTPLFLVPEDVDEKTIAKEREIYRNQAEADGKPEKILDKIVEGKLRKWYTEVCLMKQPFIKDSDITIEDLLKNSIAKLGENIVIRRFNRYQVGGEI